MKKNVWVVVAILVVIIGGFFLLNKKSVPATVVTGEGLYPGAIKVGHLVATDMAPLFIAKEAGYFKDEGLEVETIFFSNPGDNNAALSGGSVQFSINPFTLAYLGKISVAPFAFFQIPEGIALIKVVF